MLFDVLRLTSRVIRVSLLGLATVLVLIASGEAVEARFFKSLPALDFAARPVAVSVESKIIQASVAAGVPPNVALDLAAGESGFDPRAARRERNGTVSRGVFQLNSCCFPPATVDDNIRLGVAFLAQAWREFPSEREAFFAYRAGFRAARRRRGRS